MHTNSFKLASRRIAAVLRTQIAMFCILLSSASLFGEESVKFSNSIDTPYGSIVATQSFSPTPVRALEPVEMTVVIEKPSQYQLVQNDLEGDYGDFFCEFLGDESGVGGGERDTVSRRWKLYPNEQTDAERLPPIPIRLARGDHAIDEKSIVLVIPAATLAIPRIESKIDPSEIRYDLSPVKRSSFVKILVATLVVLLMALVTVIWRIKKQTRNIPSLSLAKETPLACAIRELDQIKTSNAYLENKPEFYASIDNVFRRYLLGEFQIDAPEMTSNEIIATIKASPSYPTAAVSHTFQGAHGSNENPQRALLSPNEMKAFLINVLKDNDLGARLSDLLTKLDLTKFAKTPTTFRDATKLYTSIRTLVEEASSRKEIKLKKLDSTRASEEVFHEIAQRDAN